MMFPVNRPASELTVDELLNVYNAAIRRDMNHATEDEIKTAQELRAEIERRMKPCDKQHHGQAVFGLSDIYYSPQSLLGQGGNR